MVKIKIGGEIKRAYKIKNNLKLTRKEVDKYLLQIQMIRQNRVNIITTYPKYVF